MTQLRGKNKRAKSLGLLKDNVYWYELHLKYIKLYRNYTIGATDSQTYKDSSTKITQNFNKIHDSGKNVASSPNLNDQNIVKKHEIDDTNKVAMEQLKTKLKKFIENQTLVVKQMQEKIDFLEKENQQLKQKSQ